MSSIGLAKARFAAGLVSLVVAGALVWLVLWAIAAPPLFGWSPVAVMSGSMSPRIEAGDVVVVTPYEGEPLAPGTVIVFSDPVGEGRITHRVVDTTPDGEYVTQGDANGRLDSSTVPPDEVLGVGRLLVPLAATPLVWVDRGRWVLLVVFVLALAAAAWTSRWALLDRHDPWRADGDDDDDVLRPIARGSLTPYVVVLGLALTIMAVTTTRSRSVFADATDNAGSSWSTSTLLPPTGLGAATGGADSVDLTWTPSASGWADGYEISRSTTPGSGHSPVATVPGQATAAHTEAALRPGTTYYYVAESTASGWSSVPSNEASATTSGFDDVQLAGSWGTGLTHAAPAGSDRGLVFVAGNEQRPAVESLGTWGTGLTHTAESGASRVLVLVAGFEHGSGPAPTLTGVTYGGQALTFVARDSASSGGTRNGVEVWILGEAGIAAASGSTFVPTWDVTPAQSMYSHAFFGGVDQVTPVAAQATNATTTSTPNPIATAALATIAGEEIVVAVAVAGETGSYTPQNGFAIGVDQTAGATVTMATAQKTAAGSTETPSMQHSAPNRQAIAGVVLDAAAISAPVLTAVSYGGQPLTKVTDVAVGSAVTASTEIWFLDEAGIAAAGAATFAPTWDVPPLLPSYAHAFFTGVDQSDPIGPTATAAAAGATPNPIVTSALATVGGDVVVTGAVAGEAGTYTPQNGFTLGNNQNNGSSTLGTAHKAAAAGSETPSMQHSGPNRQVIAGAVLNRRRVEQVGAWSTGLTHTVGAGDDRLLLLVAGMENAADPGTPPQGQRDLVAVTFGGQPLTEAGEAMICTTATTSSYCARVEIWYLLEAGITAATDTTFVPTWSGDPPFALEEMYAAVTLDRVQQSAPIGNVSGGIATANPVQPADPVGVGRGDLVVAAVTAGDAASYTPPAGYVEGSDQALASSTMATAGREIVADGTEQPGMTFDGTVNRHAVVALTVKATGTP